MHRTAVMDSIPSDHATAEAFGPLGDIPIVWIDCNAPGAEMLARRYRDGTRVIVAGIDRAGGCPSIDPDYFDLMLTSAAAAASPWVVVPAQRLDERMRTIQSRVTQAPLAASIAVDVIRSCAQLPVDLGLAVESLGYSTALAGDEFRKWHRDRGSVSAIDEPMDARQVLMERTDDTVTITLARPDTRNAMRAAMRDSLHEALCAVLEDPSEPDVILRGAGDCFSIGGDLAEFGTASDMAQAHAIRTLRSCAARLYELGARARVELHGASIGSGIEVAAAAAQRTARPGSFFQLPELGMGLIPGAGGTVSIARCIGRQRTVYMYLSGRRIGLSEALAWGLVEPAA